MEGGNGCTTVWMGMMLPNCMLEMVTMVNSMLSIFYVIYMLTTILKKWLREEEATSPSRWASCSRQHTAPRALPPVPCPHTMPALMEGQAGACPGSSDSAYPAFAPTHRHSCALRRPFFIPALHLDSSVEPPTLGSSVCSYP